MSVSVDREPPARRGVPVIKLQGAAGGELVFANELTAACANIASLLTTFSDLGASREVAEGELSPDIGLRQIAIYNDVRTATAALGGMTAATPVDVASVGAVIRQLRDRFGFCGFDELTVLVQAHERDLARVTSCETDRAGQAGWISRRLSGLLGRGEYTTEH